MSYLLCAGLTGLVEGCLGESFRVGPIVGLSSEASDAPVVLTLEQGHSFRSPGKPILTKTLPFALLKFELHRIRLVLARREPIARAGVARTIGPLTDIALFNVIVADQDNGLRRAFRKPDVAVGTGSNIKREAEGGSLELRDHTQKRDPRHTAAVLLGEPEIAVRPHRDRDRLTSRCRDGKGARFWPEQYCLTSRDQSKPDDEFGLKVVPCSDQCRSGRTGFFKGYFHKIRFCE